MEQTRSNLLWALLEVSEKAAIIARECRARKELFELLVEEKSGAEKNPRFIQDFKTLADVLIQETIKHHLTEKFPVLKDRILGEENNKFTNAKGQSILVEIKPTEKETAELLQKVLDGNATAATILARAIFQNPDVDASVKADFEKVKDAVNSTDIPLDDIAIWIDPIDGTHEYVQGEWDEAAKGGPSRFGLNCCTILIGGYRLSTGDPCFSTVSQPFSGPDVGPTTTYYCFGNIHNIIQRDRRSNVILSSMEKPEIVKKLEDSRLSTVTASGAGYKILLVALGYGDVYLCSKGSTYRWDACASHALVRAQGGDIVTFQGAKPVKYNVSKAEAANSDGLIAFRTKQALEDVMTAI